MTTILPTPTSTLDDLHRLYQEIATYFPAWEVEICHNTAYFTRPGGAVFRLLWLDSNPQEIALSAFEPVHLDAPQDCLPHELPSHIMVQRMLPAQEIAETISRDYLGKYFDNFHAYLTYGDKAKVEAWQEEHRQAEAFKEVIAQYPAFSDCFRQHGKRYSLEVDNPEYQIFLSMRGERGMDTVRMEIECLPLSVAIKILTAIGDSLS